MSEESVRTMIKLVNRYGDCDERRYVENGLSASDDETAELLDAIEMRNICSRAKLVKNFIGELCIKIGGKTIIKTKPTKKPNIDIKKADLDEVFS